MSNFILQSTTFFIKQNGKLIGMLCINFDDSRYHAVSEEILRLCHPDKFVDTNFQVDTSRIDELSAIPAPPPERFHSSSGSVAEEAVYRALDRLGLSPLRLTPEERMEIIAGLEADGIFLLKGAVKPVADALQCSQASIYRYLSQIRRDRTGQHNQAEAE